MKKKEGEEYRLHARGVRRCTGANEEFSSSHEYYHAPHSPDINDCDRNLTDSARL